MYRIEKDALGQLEVPKEAYYGIFTQRARVNFPLTKTATHPELIKALGIVKFACAQANIELKQLDNRKGNAIIHACKEVIHGRFNNQFILDMIQAGAGTPFNMNANEVIANRAQEILGGERGKYDLVNPNDHVNLGQSSNNVIPTAIRIASLSLLDTLLKELEHLEKEFWKKSKEFDKIVKIGRTHLQDAVPIRLGQEFDSYRETISRGLARIKRSSEELQELGIGGTAIGTGINTHPSFDKLAVRNISRFTGKRFFVTKNHVYLTQSMTAFASLASSLEIFCSEIIKICNDMIVLSSGPKGGLHELSLPEVEPGSSIMPGKVNPSIAEAMKMACMQVKGQCNIIISAVQEGSLELNIFTPLIAYNIFNSLEILTNGLKVFREFCVKGIKANEKRIRELFESSTATATALSPYLGYKLTAELVREALAENKSIKEIIMMKGLIEEKDLEKILDPSNLTRPRPIDKELKYRIQKNLK